MKNHMGIAATHYATLTLVVLTACAPAHNEWQDIDYSSVYRANAARENDPAYTQPTVISCVDDDLYNCNK